MPAELRVEADRDQLERILLNLLSNAFKFTPSGGSVRLSVAGHGGRVVLHVSDTGRGIAGEHKQRIFEPFEQLEEMRHKHSPGVGLGLSIVKQVMDSPRGRASPQGDSGRRQDSSKRACAGSRITRPRRKPEPARQLFFVTSREGWRVTHRNSAPSVIGAPIALAPLTLFKEELMSKQFLFSSCVTLAFLTGCLGAPEEGQLAASDHDLTQAVCSGLSEQACLTTTGCELVYPACPAIACDAAGNCPQCDPTPRCQEASPALPPPPVDHCASLNERACNQASGCVGIYSGTCPPCPPTAVCMPCDPDSFTFSHCVIDTPSCGTVSIDGGFPEPGPVDAGTPTDPPSP